MQSRYQSKTQKRRVNTTQIHINSTNCFQGRETRFNGSRYIDARRYFSSADGWKPSPSGLHLDPYNWAELIPLIKDAIEAFPDAEHDVVIGKVQKDLTQRYLVSITNYKNKKAIDVRKMIHDYEKGEDIFTRSGFRGSPNFMQRIIDEVIKLIED
jgi:hypothetical protein